MNIITDIAIATTCIFTRDLTKFIMHKILILDRNILDNTLMIPETTIIIISVHKRY